MAKPTFDVDVGFGVSTLVFLIGHGRIGVDRLGGSSEDGVTWSALTGVQEVHISRGRQDDLGKIEAGRCTVIADNTAGNFSPENTGGSYSPNVRPMKKIRVTATLPGGDWDYINMVLADNPEGHWWLGESAGTVAGDDSGNGHDGTYTGGYTLGQSGTVSWHTATLFNGSSGYVTMGDVAALEFARTFSLEAWVKPTDVSTSAFGDPVIAKESGGTGYQLTWDGTNQRFGLMTDGGTMTWGNAAKALGVWYHVVATYDGARARMYVDGRLETSAIVTYTANASALFTLAAFYDGAAYGRFLAATIQDVAAYGYALSLQQIRNHWRQKYCLFYGNIERWRPDLQDNLATVRIEATDLFLRLAGQEYTTTAQSEQKVGARIDAVLDWIKLPAAMRDLDTGISTIPAYTPSQLKSLQHIEDILVAEDGLFWIAGDGMAVFRDRYARLQDSGSMNSQATFGGASGLPCQFGEYDYGIDHVYNDVRCLRTGGAEQSSTDSASQVAYGVRTLRRNSDHLLNDQEAAGLAGWYKGQYRTPIQRLKSIILEAGGNNNLWTQMLAREIGDRITVVRTFPGSVGLNRAFWIEGIRHDIVEGLNAHRTEMLISAADIVPWLQIGHATRGKIGTGRIGY